MGVRSRREKAAHSLLAQGHKRPPRSGFASPGALEQPLSRPSLPPGQSRGSNGPVPDHNPAPFATGEALSRASYWGQIHRPSLQPSRPFRERGQTKRRSACLFPEDAKGRATIGPTSMVLKGSRRIPNAMESLRRRAYLIAALRCIRAPPCGRGSSGEVKGRPN